MTTEASLVLSATDKTKAAFQSVETNLGALRSKADSLLGGGMVGGAGGLATAILGAGFVGTLKSAIDSLDQMDEAAERISTTTESLSALAYAGQQTGVEFETLTGGLSKLSVKMQEAFSGNKEAVALFKDLGVNVEGADKKLKSSDQVFGEVAERFSQLADGADKTALAVDLFGRSGANMVPMLNLGAAGLKTMREEAEAYGGIIDGKLAKQAADFNDNLDRLGTVSAAAGKALAGEFVPALNTVTENLLQAIRTSDGFWSSLAKFATMNPFKDHGLRLIEMKNEFEQLDYKLSNGRSKDAAADQARMATLEKEIAYYQAIEDLRNGTGPKSETKQTISRTPSGDKKKAASEATASFKDYDAILTERIASAIDKTDTVKAAELVSMLEKLDELAAAGLDPTIVKAVRDDLTGATKTAADEVKRLNDLLDATPSAALEKTRADMELLTAALQDGRINEEKYLEAVNARLEDHSEKLKEEKSLAEELGLTFTSAFESSIADGGKFSNILKGLEQDLIRLIARLVITQPLMKAVTGTDWSSVIGSGVGAMFGSSTSTASTPTATESWIDSGGLGRASGGPVQSGKTYLVGENGPELLQMGATGGGIVPNEALVGAGGASVQVNVINNSNAQATASERSDGKGGKIIDVLIEQVKGAIAGDIASGNGPIPNAMQSAYGLSRGPGAY